jgi:hypothetical protein
MSLPSWILSNDSGDDEEIYLFCNIILLVPWEVNKGFGGRHRLHFEEGRNQHEAATNLSIPMSNAFYTLIRLPAACFTPAHYVAYTLILKIQAACSAEMSAYLHHTSQRYIPYD